ncbi:hypothetical protein [Streptomyces sp. NPDC002520]
MPRYVKSVVFPLVRAAEPVNTALRDLGVDLIPFATRRLGDLFPGQPVELASLTALVFLDREVMGAAFGIT